MYNLLLGGLFMLGSAWPPCLQHLGRQDDRYAFWHEMDVWLSVFLSTYVIKFIVSLCSTPFLYAARSFTFKEEYLKMAEQTR